MVHKFEKPERLAELTTKTTLRRFGLSSDSIFCDVGAGTGIFSFAAAGITSNTIYSVEISSEMLEILQSKKKEGDFRNIVIEGGIERIPPHSCDLVLLSTVLHEVEDPISMISEIERIMKPDGALGIIEFHKRVTSMGPPVEERLSKEDIITMMAGSSLLLNDEFILGENYYCLRFEKMT